MSLLLSSIWVQATSAENTPANFEAMAHSYNVALLFTRSKVRTGCIFYYVIDLAMNIFQHPYNLVNAAHFDPHNPVFLYIDNFFLLINV